MKKYDPRVVAALDAFLEELPPRQQEEALRIAHNRYALILRNRDIEHRRVYQRRYFKYVPDVREKAKKRYENVVKPKRWAERIERYKQKKEDESFDRET
ncbi:MAG: hypothetical protein II264_04640 [Ruminococcus sp.]|nr:hypothetical protein [Ruminococcus sp.]